jgi:hypothetical protein
MQDRLGVLVALVLIAIFGIPTNAVAGTTPTNLVTHVYDGPSVAAADAWESEGAATVPIQFSGAREQPASRSAVGRGTSTTSTRSVVATNTTRGLSRHGGIIEQAGTNSAGGRIFTSTGAIDQSDFAGIVNSGLARGDDVHILTGAHGLPNGSIVADGGLLADDVARFGDLPGVHIYDLPSMSPAEIQAVLNRPGTIIGGFCDSGACLAPYSG